MSSDIIRILLADDHVMVRAGLAALVTDDCSIEVIGQCGDGLEVPGMVERLKPDVLVLDITMPGLNGLDVCRELNSREHPPAILVLTMHNEERFVIRAFRHGVKGYLLKESAAEVLPQAITKVASGELFLGPGLPADLLKQAHEQTKDTYDTLSSRERQVLQMIAEGRTNRQIAHDLGLAPKTIDTHRTRLMRKLDIHDQTSLVKFAISHGVITVPKA